MAGRDTLRAHLAGSGIEVGPGHVPFEVPAGVSVRYVDRLTSDEHSRLFPEMAGSFGFVEPDVLADLDTDRLGAIASESEDFVIGSHVIEHLADPLGFLDDVHRVLRPGGVLLILVPDRRYTFDRDRSPTPLACLVRDHDAGATAPDDAHLLEFLLDVDQGPDFVLPDDPEERAALFDWHRSRSIHVHCWTDDEFPEVLRYCVDDLGHEWTVVEQFGSEDGGGEFGYVLARSSHTRSRRFALRKRTSI
jgi:SAM-dependent methyltransferase